MMDKSYRLEARILLKMELEVSTTKNNLQEELMQ